MGEGSLLSRLLTEPVFLPLQALAHYWKKVFSLPAWGSNQLRAMGASSGSLHRECVLLGLIIDPIQVSISLTKRKIIQSPMRLACCVDAASTPWNHGKGWVMRRKVLQEARHGKIS